MKGLFYFPINVDIFPDASIVKKNDHLTTAVTKLGVEADVVTFSSSGIKLNGSLIKTFPNNRFSRGLYNNVLGFKAVVEACEVGKYDFFWIRGGLTNPPQLAFLKRLREENPQAKVLLEYGSFPFKDELFGYQKLLYPLHTRLSPRLKKYISYIITYCGQDEIYGIPCIKIGNGIDTTQIPFSEPGVKGSTRIDLISVSSLMYWHACDRVIAGMKDYYDGTAKAEPEVIFHIVGESTERAELQKLVSAAGLEERVIFHGFQTGRELDRLFEQSDLAIGTLGMHRKHLLADSSLKNREYFARGLPLVLATPDADFPADLPFVKYLPADESPIDIAGLVDFLNNLRESVPDYPRAIREYAEENLTWEAKFRQVMDVLAEK